jgi:hypothetical protein
LLKNPPIVMVGGKIFAPVRRPDFYALRKAHNDTHWRWTVFQWEPLEESYYATALTPEEIVALIYTWRARYEGSQERP